MMRMLREEKMKNIFQLESARCEVDKLLKLLKTQEKEKATLTAKCKQVRNK